MAIISLPDWAVPNAAEPSLLDFGGVLRPFLGGPAQRINRPGSRFKLRVSLPPQPTRDAALVIQSRLLQARDDRLRMEWPQPDVDLGNPGAPKVRAATLGSVLPMKGLAADYGIREGTVLSIIRGARRYVHMFAAPAVADGAGNVDAMIYPMLRVTVQQDDVIEMVKPMIEGLVNPGDELGWQISVDRLASFSFTLEEAA